MSDGRQKIGLLQSELKVLLESMPEAVFIFSADGVVAETNSAAQKLFGNGLRGMGLTALMQEMAVERGGRHLLVSDSAVSRARRREAWVMGSGCHRDLARRLGREPAPAGLTG